MERINREMESEEARRRREAEKERKRLEMLKNSGTLDHEEIERLIKEHEHNTKVLRDAYLREQKRQLDLMNDGKQRLE